MTLRVWIPGTGWAGLPAPRRPPPRPASKSPCSAATRRPPTLFARDGAAMIRPIPAPPRRDQRGAAVISALIIVAIVAALTTSLFQRQTASVRRLENEQSRLQARMLLAGGIDWARLVVRDHGKREAVTRRTRSGPPHPGHAHRASRRRARGRVLRRAGGRTGQVQPVQPGARRRAAAGRGTGAAAAAGPAAPAGHASAAHHRHRGHGPAAGAARRSAALRSAAARPRAAARRAGTGRRAGPGSRRARRTATHHDAAAREHAGQRQHRPARVIAALAPGLSIGQARAIAGERDRGNAFNNSGDFANRLAGAGFKGTPPAVVTASGWFMARGVVVYERARLTAQALLRATPGAAPATVWMREDN